MIKDKYDNVKAKFSSQSNENPLAREQIVEQTNPLDFNRERFQQETEVKWNAIGIAYKGKMPDIEFTMGGEPAKEGYAPDQSTNGNIKLNVPLPADYGANASDNMHAKYVRPDELIT